MIGDTSRSCRLLIDSNLRDLRRYFCSIVTQFIVSKAQTIIVSESTEIKGSRLGKRAFRKLNSPNRGFVSIGQMFRATTGDDSYSDSLSSDEVRVRSRNNFEREIGLDELSSAGTSFLKSELPNRRINSEMNTFGAKFKRKFVFQSDLVLPRLQKTFTPTTVWLTMITFMALNAYLIQLPAKLVVIIGLFCQTCFGLLFGTAEERQFDLWSKFWSGTCKLSEQQLVKLKRNFDRKNAVSNFFKIFASLSLLQIFSNEAETDLHRQVLIATSVCLVGSVFRKLNSVKSILLVLAVLPHLVQHLSDQNLGVKQLGLMLRSQMLSSETLSKIYSTVSTSGSEILISVASVFSNDPEILKILSLSAIIRFVTKTSDLTLIYILAFGLVISSIRAKFRRFRTILTVGLFVGLLIQLGQVGNQLKPVDSSSKPLAGLTWSKFNQICPKNGDISTKLLCSNFIGRTVQWDGRVHDISLERKPQNVRETISSFLPGVVGRIVGDRKSLAPKAVESFCKIFKTEFRQSNCENLSSLESFRCRVSIEMSRSLFSGDAQRVVGDVEDLELCLKLKAGSYFQFVATIDDVIEETRVKVHSLKSL